MVAKFFGKVGYGAPVDRQNGIWEDEITERQYFGDVVTISRRLAAGEEINGDLSTDTSIEILADAFANEHFFAIRYVEWSGALWSVSKVDVRGPRLILRLGSVYNGPRPSTTSNTA
jgi:hypothetical protein